MKIIIYTDICELSTSQLHAIENIAIAHQATMERVSGLDREGGKVFAIESDTVSFQEGPEFNDISQEIEKAIAKFS